MISVVSLAVPQLIHAKTHIYFFAKPYTYSSHCLVYSFAFASPGGRIFVAQIAHSPASRSII